MGKIIGIDLGTTNSCVSVMEGQDPTVIVNQEGKRTTPSVIAFLDNGEIAVGERAKRQAAINPEKTIFSIKRFMGKTWEEAKEIATKVPYKVVSGPNNTVRVQVGDRMYSPQELSAMILQKLKKAAEDYLGEEVKEAVITVPAYFNDAQRKATKEAGEIAGLTVRRIINEPTAAALAYHKQKNPGEVRIAVFDLGGGTFDVSILELSEDMTEVISTSGDNFLGGDNFDERIVEWMAGEFKKQHGIDLTQDATALQRMKEAAETAKKELSSMMETEINLPYIFVDSQGPKHLQLKLTRAKFENLCADLFERLKSPCQKALNAKNLTPSDIDEVILVGGSTRIPKVQQIVEEFFGKKPLKGINPDEVVAVGAAIQGGILAGEVKGMLLLDVTPLSLGIETMGGKFTKLIEANTTIPVKKSEIFTTAADNQSQVEVHVLQGERPLAADNKSLGRFILEGIPPAPRGVPQIEVTFDIDANGILTVSAKDKATGKEQKIRIEATSGLTPEEIERMKREAEMNAEEDRKRAEKIEKLNQADNLIYSAEKLLREHGNKVPGDKKVTIEGLINDLREAHKTENLARIDHLMPELTNVLNEVGQVIHQAGGNASAEGTGQQAGNASQGGTNEDATDVEYEEVD